MSLSAGTRLGPYEVGAEIGAGGMGNVYRAHDTRLGRDVAIKTIKGPYTERFEREARAISSLNHPHICTLFDVGKHEGSGYLVMEHVEGKPLAGPLPPDQAIAYGIQICEALHAAHRKGIVHRDLKPANILLTKQGVKLLDFGLAKVNAVSSVSGAEAGAAAERATVAALTGAHTVVGTPQYMAPEQISGGEVDARTDIFAFGCVLYELLTGRRAFDGKTMSSVMAAVLAAKPEPIEQLVPLTPPALERVIARCLAKDPDDRWQSARDIAAELQWIAQGGSRVGLPVAIATRRKAREAIAWTACGLALAAAAGFAFAWAQRAPEPPPLVRFAIEAPSGLSAVGPPAVSPDGRMVAFDAADERGQRQIWVRSLDALEARPISGTEGAFRPFWSPDSRFLGFIAGGKLKKVPIAGGPPQTLCDLPTGADGTWSSEGVILLDGRANDPIWRVSANGGTAEVEIANPGNVSLGWPDFLPDGRHFLYMSFASGGQQTLMARALGSGEAKELLTTSSRVQYAPPGFLLYVREQTLVAHPFDPDALALTGDPIPIGEGLGVDNVGLAAFSVSRTGVLAMRPGESTDLQLVWTDRAGNQKAIFEAPGQLRDASLSPDGTRLAFDRDAGGGRDIWIRDLGRGVTSRFTFDPAARPTNPLWSPDGRRLVYSMRGSRAIDLMVKDASATRDAELLLETDQDKFVSDWTRDGTHVLYATQSEKSGWDLWALPVGGGERKPFPVAQTRFDELFGSISPDGRYVAYFSDESGRAEVYVQEFPEPRNKWQISTSGGAEPFWSADGRELYYRAGQDIMRLPVQTSGTFTAGTPARLFQARFPRIIVRAHYRPTRDPNRFIALVPASQNQTVPTVLVLNWTRALGD